MWILDKHKYQFITYKEDVLLIIEVLRPEFDSLKNLKILVLCIIQNPAT